LLTPDSLDTHEEVQAPTLVERVEMPPAREFVARYVRRAQPVILAGAARHWPARTRWEPQELARRFSDRAVPVVRSGQGGSLFDPWNGVNYAPMTVRAYVEAVAEQRSDLYMIFRVQDHLSELLDDIEVPDVCARAAWFRARFWFAIDGTAGPLHADLPHNLYAQVVGRKQFLLAHYRHTARVYPFPPWSGVPNYCRVDPERPDLTRFPRFAGVKLELATLEPGDMLYIPSLYWHQARALSDSASINLWWADGVLRRVVSVAEWFMKARGLNL